MSAEAAAAITGVLNALPDTASADELTRAEALLVTQAQTLDPGELGLCGQALKDALTVTPDVDDPAEAERVAKDAEDAEAREAAEWERRAVRLISRRDGMLGITGTLDALSGALVREILEAAARPVDAVDGVTDDRHPGQRMADALTELITTLGPLDLDQDAGMTTSTGDDAENSVDPDAENSADPDAEDADLDDLEDLDDGESADPGDPGDLDAADRPDADGIGDLGDLADLGDVGEPVLDFGDGFDPTGAPDTQRGAGTQQTPDTGNECCRGANRAHRRAHRAGTGHRKRAGRRQPPTARPGVMVSLIVDWGLLHAGLAGGTLPDGTMLSPAATLAALCDAGIIP